ncbi:MAG: transcription antitermination factor NusB [Anaerolineae bacterium]|nr:transcription antitermination factor NusB [Anaerolineae bacterium]
MDDVEKTEIIEHDPAMTEYSEARRIALQVLYEVDCSGHGIGTTVAARLVDTQLTDRSIRRLRSLTRNVWANRRHIDAIIHHFAPEWPLDQIAIVDRNILRIAIYELFFIENQPVSVIIAEAVELAKLYGAESTVRFVNGVLGTLADNDEAVRAMLLQMDNQTDKE